MGGLAGKYARENCERQRDDLERISGDPHAG